LRRKPAAHVSGDRDIIDHRRLNYNHKIRMFSLRPILLIVVLLIVFILLRRSFRR